MSGRRIPGTAYSIRCSNIHALAQKKRYLLPRISVITYGVPRIKKAKRTDTPYAEYKQLNMVSREAKSSGIFLCFQKDSRRALLAEMTALERTLYFEIGLI
jgi:hypothetical protein